MNLFNIVHDTKKDSISILGLSFKPNTPTITDSASIELAWRLLQEGKNVNLYDPLCMNEVKKKFEPFVTTSLNYFDSLEECFKAGELVVVALPYDEFKTIDDTWKSFDDQIILDCWRFLDENKFNDISYKCLGRKD